MSFLKATKRKLRFQTPVGNLTTEQLWDLELTMLDSLAVNLEKQYKQSKGKSFLDTKTTKDKDIKLQFDVVLSILEEKVKDQTTAQKSMDTKAHNQKIDELIAKKKDENLGEKSVEELEALRK